MHTGEAEGPKTASPGAVTARKGAQQGAGGFLRAENLNAFLEMTTTAGLPHPWGILPWGNPKDCTNL